MTEDEIVEAMCVSFLLSLTQSGVSADVQGLLCYGDERGTVGPNALKKALRIAIPWAREQTLREAA